MVSDPVIERKKDKKIDQQLLLGIVFIVFRFTHLLFGKMLIEGKAYICDKRGALQLPLQMGAQELRLQLCGDVRRRIVQVKYREQISQTATIRFEGVILDKL